MRPKSGFTVWGALQKKGGRILLRHSRYISWMTSRTSGHASFR